MSTAYIDIRDQWALRLKIPVGIDRRVLRRIRAAQSTETKTQRDIKKKYLVKKGEK